MNADDRDAYDFGVKKVGTWDSNGLPTGWHTDEAHIADDLPRWLRDQPVLSLADGPACCVYLRGCYSDQMTRDRKAALVKAGGATALLNATGGAAGRVCVAQLGREKASRPPPPTTPNIRVTYPVVP